MVATAKETANIEHKYKLSALPVTGTFCYSKISNLFDVHVRASPLGKHLVGHNTTGRLHFTHCKIPKQEVHTGKHTQQLSHFLLYREILRETS